MVKKAKKQKSEKLKVKSNSSTLSKFEVMSNNVLKYVLPEFLQPKERFNLLFLSKRIRLKLKKHKIGLGYYLSVIILKLFNCLNYYCLI